jgi:Glycosyl transferases group 1
MIRVNLIGKSNGAGLSRDLDILAAVLRQCGCDLTVTPVGSRESRRRRSILGKLLRAVGMVGQRQSRRYDINVMLEHVWPQFLADAQTNVVVPNPEWFDRHDLHMLSYADQVWSKTGNTERIFTELGKRGALIGFDSEDRYDSLVLRERTFIHLAGKSTMKGTDRLLQIWSRHPEWPRLTVVGTKIRKGKRQNSNVEIVNEHLDDAELRTLQNAHLFHVCTSETEGWGHYLAEALGIGAIVFTTDAPPMNELVTPDRGFLLHALPFRRQELAQCFTFDEQSLTTAIDAAMALPKEDLDRMRKAARDWFLENKANFAKRINQALEGARGLS